jgi:MFS family permease
MAAIRAFLGVDFTAVRRLFLNRNFSLYTIGKLLANLGEWAQRVTLGWLAWELTHSTFWLGVVGFADLIPTVVVGLLAGAWVDRSDYMRLVKSVQVAAVLVSVTLTLFTAAGFMTIELLALLTLLRGTAQAFYRPARMVLVYNLVECRDLAPAIAISSIVFNGARFVGPAIGGGLMVVGGPVFSFAAAAASYIAFLLILMTMTVPATPPRKAARRGILAETAAGIAHAVSREGIALLLMITMVVALAVRPFLDLLPAFAGDVFASGVGGLTVLLTANGLGATVAGIWLAGRPGGVGGLTGVVIANLLAIGVSVLAFALMPSIWLALPFLAVAGFGLVVQGVAVQTLVQSSVESAMRGRVLGLYALLARGCPALGALIIGGLAEWLGARIPVALGALIALLLWLLVARRRAAVAAAVEKEPERPPAPVSEHGDVSE